LLESCDGANAGIEDPRVQGKLRESRVAVLIGAKHCVDSVIAIILIGLDDSYLVVGNWQACVSGDDSNPQHWFFFDCSDRRIALMRLARSR
jgi:hypothetical protein